MAKIIVAVNDKINEDFYLNCGCFKRGDVIEILDDDIDEGIMVRNNPDWRIIYLPQHTKEQLEILRWSEQPTDPFNIPKTLQYRGAKFDIDNPDLPQEIKDIVNNPLPEEALTADNTTSKNTTADTTESATPFNIFDFQVMKEPIKDPAIFGEPNKVFG